MNNLQSSFRSMIRNFGMTFTSFLLVMLTLMVFGFVVMISVNTAHFAENMVNSLNVFVFVDTSATEEETLQVGEEIAKIDEVDEIVLSTKDEELELIASAMGEDGDDILEIFSGDANPLNDIYILTLNEGESNFEGVATEIEQIEHVERVDYGGEAGTNAFLELMSIIQIIAILVALILFLVSLFMITNTIKLTINSRRREIEIMRLVGATKMYIRQPFIYEGLIIGFIAGLLAAILLSITYGLFLDSYLLRNLSESLILHGDMRKILIVSLPLIGSVIGVVGSFLAVRKYLRY